MRAAITAIAIGLVAATAVSTSPAEARKGKTYERSKGTVTYRVGGERRRTAVFGYERRVGGFSEPLFAYDDNLDIRALPPSPKDGGPYQDFSPVNTDTPISRDPYP